MNDSEGSYDFGASISQPLLLPGGSRFLARVLVTATVLLMLIYLTFGRSLLTAYIDFFQIAMTLEDPESPEALSAMMGSMWALTLPMMGMWLGAWFVMVSAETAFHLNVFKGIDRGWFPLRFGMPELGVWVAQLVVGMIVFGVYITGYIVIAILFVITAFAAQKSGIVAIMAGVCVFAAMLAWIAAMALAVVRLSPAAALSVRDGDIRTIEGWALTKGRFWAMFGGYAVVGIAGYVVSVFIMLIAFLVMFGGISIFEPLSKISDTTDPAQVFSTIGNILSTPRVVVGGILAGFIMMLFSVFWRSFFWGIPNYVVQCANLNAENVDESGEVG